MTELEKAKDSIKGRCHGCEFAVILSSGNWSFPACTHKPHKGKRCSEINDCPKEAINEPTL